jgi:uncharacterized DUF497 family protein
MTMNDIQFTWDEAKNLANIRKHGVGFDDAIRAYHDPNRLDIYDADHSTINEPRWIYLGLANITLLYVVETEPEENLIRIISARRALKKEQEQYHGNRD